MLLSRPPEVEPGPLRDLIEFPADDLELLKQPRECRTTESGVPEDGCVLHTHTTPHPLPESHTPRSTFRLWTPVWPWANHCPSEPSFVTSLTKSILLLLVDVCVYCVCACVCLCVCVCTQLISVQSHASGIFLFLVFSNILRQSFSLEPRACQVG